MQKRYSVLLVVAVLVLSLAGSLIAAPRANAQGDSIAFGEVVSGKINSGETIPYAFEGAKGEFVVAQLAPSVEDGAIGVELAISDSSGAKIADSTELIIFGQIGVIIGVELTDSGPFTLEVMASDSVSPGGYDVLLLKAEVLEDGAAVEGEASTPDQGVRNLYKSFYVIDTNDDSSLAYEKTGGNYAPSLVVYGVEAGNNLYPRAYLGGASLSGGSILLPGERSYRFATVGSLNFGGQSNADPATSTYKLTLEAAK